MTLIERILCKLFSHFDITDHETGEVYLRRWFVYPRKPKDEKLRPRIYLHKFCKSDNTRDLHDHPWRFRSLILWGGYWEHSYNPAYQRWLAEPMNVVVNWAPAKTRRKWYGPGSWIKRGAKWTHAVELRDFKPAWTLFFTGVKERSWGFHTEHGWCWWRNYKNGVCWCYDNPNEKI